MNDLISNKRILACFAASLFLLSTLLVAVPVKATSVNYGNVSLSSSGSWPPDGGHFDDVWDLTAGDMVISFTYDANGLVDDAGTHAWAELGVRSLGTPDDFNPYWRYNTKVTDLIAGQSNYVGFVWAWRSGNYLYVQYIITESECVLAETHLAVIKVESNVVYPADIPQTKKGNPIPGQFPYSTSHDPPVSEYTYVIEWDSISGLGSVLALAAHAVVVCPLGEDTAWGDGKEFVGANWATYFYYQVSTKAGSGVWLATDFEWTANTFDPDTLVWYGPPINGWYGVLDLDDKLILQRKGGTDESWYNLPSTPPAPGANHRVWWDRDGVDPWQNGATANTGGIYQIVITLHATSATTGTAYMNIRGLDQGFEVDGNWNTIELTPAGMTFTGDMAHLQVFYGLFGYGATHSVTFSDITVTQ